MRVCVKVPDAGAEVWLEGIAMAGSGTERWFESPALVPGADYVYSVTAKWGGNQIETKRVTGQAGGDAIAEFTSATASRLLPTPKP